MTNSEPLFNCLLIGSGGREHALAWKLSQSHRVNHVYVAPGNGGTARGLPKVSNVDLSEMDFKGLIEFSHSNNIGLAIVGPEKPLVSGITDAFRKAGIPCFGPSAKAAQLEGSKAFSKEFMKANGIPTAQFEIFTKFESAKQYIEACTHKLVIKASGLAAGKGVLIPETKEQAIRELEMVMVERLFGAAGDSVVIEEYLEGEECSILAFSDGYTVMPLPAAQDHKRAYDGDSGPNTGGMGAYAPAPIVTPQMMDTIKRTVLQPTVDGMRRSGMPFVGILYAGLMLCNGEIKVLEYNCRFGDPETQVLVPLIASDLSELMLACVEGRLDSVPLMIKDEYACTVVAASAGYPGDYTKGVSITLTPTAVQADAMLFHAGTMIVNDSHLVTSGGRVLAMTGVGQTLYKAVQNAYCALESVKFQGMHFRRDIGHRALQPKAPVTKNTYEQAGVSIDRGNELVQRIKPFVKSTRRPGADGEIGGFGGLFDLKAAGYYKDPILVSGTDGVGTKLKLAQAIGKHDTIGVDLVAMCVNDLIVQGAEPLLFLDYFACGKLNVPQAAEVVSGIAKGCLEAGCALVGGETAEMPGMYGEGDYDLAGFSVGAVERENLLPKTDDIHAGDLLIGLPSSGVHSNGYSMVRHLAKQSGLDWQQPAPFETEHSQLGQALLEPTRIYIKQLLPLLRSNLVKAMAHITGGGLLENIPRVLPAGVGAELDASQWPLLPVFGWLKRVGGGMSNEELSRTFNCGIGMVLVVGREQFNASQFQSLMKDEKFYVIGKLVDQSGVSILNNSHW